MVPSISAARESWAIRQKCEKLGTVQLLQWKEGMNSPLGTDPENENASSCWAAAIYSESSSAPPELHGESPGTRRTCPAALATGREKGVVRKETKFICEGFSLFWIVIIRQQQSSNNKKRKIKKILFWWFQVPIIDKLHLWSSLTRNLSCSCFSFSLSLFFNRSSVSIAHLL